jgi:hypothetical protein
MSDFGDKPHEELKVFRFVKNALAVYMVNVCGKAREHL